MRKNEFAKLLQTMAAAWTRRDHTEVLKAFAPDIRYADPTRYSFAGLQQLREFFGPDGGGQPQICSFHLAVFDEDQQVGAAEYTYEGEHRYHGVVLIRLSNGLISHWREYQHIDERDHAAFVSTTAF